jgi:hypothetical protein
MGHPDFRVEGKIFATLGPGEKWGMVKLTPAQQQGFLKKAPDVFEPCSGAWGRGGATKVHLETARVLLVHSALDSAWHNVTAKKVRR